MNILWHMPTLRTSVCGISRRACMFARELTRQGHRVHFVVRRVKTNIESDNWSGFPVLRMDVADEDMPHWSLQAVGRRRTARHVVKLCDEPHDLFITCQPEAVTAYKRRQPGAPALFVCGGTTLLHDAADEARHDRRSKLNSLAFAIDRIMKHRNERTAFHAADLIIFNSRMARDIVIEHYSINENKCRVVYGGVDAERFVPPTTIQREQARTRFGIGTGEFVIAWTGRLSPEKNLPLLLDAIAQCRARLSLLIAGDGVMNSTLVARAESHGISSSVRFAGACDDVRPILHAADMFAFPSIGESFGNALAEAMACGLPCVALRSNGRSVCNASAELLDDGNAGRVIAAPIASEMSAVIDELATDPVLRRRLGNAANLRARALFDWRAGGRMFCELATVLAGRGRVVASDDASDAQAPLPLVTNCG